MVKANGFNIAEKCKNIKTALEMSLYGEKDTVSLNSFIDTDDII